MIKNSNVIRNSSDCDNDLVSNSLGKLAKGVVVLFFAVILGIFFNFIARVIIAHFYTPNDYGLFNLFFTILSIFGVIAILGLGTGMTRFIGYYTGTGEKNKIKAVEGWGLLIGVASGITFGILLFFLAPVIAPFFSKESIFIEYLRIGAVTLPFYVLINTLITIFRGHQRMKERILFYDLGMNIVFLTLSFSVGLLTIQFIGVIWSMFIAISLMSIFFFLYYIKKHKSVLKNLNSYSFNLSMGKTILLFSLPLLMVDIMQQFLGWTDTLMIGYFMSASAVGFYEVAKPLSIFITTGLTVSVFLYAPLAASLYSQGKLNENKEIYSTLTKWICFLTLPLAMVLFFFSEIIISVFFGIAYISAAIPLKILSIAFFINTMTGPDGSTLTAYGKTKFLMYATVLTAVINFILNLIFIPKYGIVGAAFATGFSLILINIVRIYKLYLISGIHSLKPQNIKPILSTIFLGSLLALILISTSMPKILQAIIAFILLSVLFFTMILLTHSITKQDLILLELIERKIGINLSLFKRLFRKYI